MTRVCKKREMEKELNAENFRPVHQWFRTDCRDCEREKQAKWRAANPGWAATNSQKWREKQEPGTLKEYSRRWYQDHKEQNKAATRAWYVKNNICHRERALQRKYQMSLSEYTSLLDRQAGGCAICGLESRDLPGKRLVVDHCHTSGRVRGLLCTKCNNLLGQAEDCQIRLFRAIEYLKTH